MAEKIKKNEINTEVLEDTPKARKEWWAKIWKDILGVDVEDPSDEFGEEIAELEKVREGLNGTSSVVQQVDTPTITDTANKGGKRKGAKSDQSPNIKKPEQKETER